MTAQTRSVLQSYFVAGARPSAAQFVDLTDSFALVPSGANALTKASAATGLVRASADTGSARAVELGAGAVIFLSAITTNARIALLGAGAVGSAVWAAAGAATAIPALGAGAVGSALFVATTTAGAQQTLGVGAPFRAAFDASTTASAQSQLGIAAGAGASAATTAQVSGATNNSAMMTPGRAHFHPGVLKAWATWQGSAVAAAKCSIYASFNVASVSGLGQETYRVTWGSAFPTKNYAWHVFNQLPSRAANAQISAGLYVAVNSAGAQQTSDVQIQGCNSDALGAASSYKQSALSIYAYSH